MTFPNLAGVATTDLVEKIGTGKFQASYINWSRTMNLLRANAPGWLVDYVPTSDGAMLHKAPVGGYLLIRFVNIDTGAETPALPQAVMDHRNNAIPFDKITARDITDTQRRGMCLAAAMHFGLAYELWAKLPMESGYKTDSGETAEAPKAAPTSTPAKGTAEAVKASEASFREAALAKGVNTFAIDVVCKKLNGNWEGGLKALKDKTADEINAEYGPLEPQGDEEQW